MKAVPVLQVDAFTLTPFSGNPAGVVLDAAGLSDAEMQKIAAEMNVSETAFVTPTIRPGADFRLRWFTPSGKEVNFCGHATVATVHALAESGAVKTSTIVFDTLGGLLPATHDGKLVWLEPPLASATPFDGPLEELLDALDLGRESLGAWGRPSLTPEKDLLLPVSGITVLRTLAPDFNRLAGIGIRSKLRGVCLTALETFDAASTTHSRFFAPHFGINEDPVTGSVHASIPIWLWQEGVLTGSGPVVRLQAEQGDLIGRPGRIAMELHLSNGAPSRVRVGGAAVTVLTGTIHLEAIPKRL